MAIISQNGLTDCILSGLVTGPGLCSGLDSTDKTAGGLLSSDEIDVGEAGGRAKVPSVAITHKGFYVAAL